MISMGGRPVRSPARNRRTASDRNSGVYTRFFRFVVMNVSSPILTDQHCPRNRGMPNRDGAVYA